MDRTNFEHYVPLPPNFELTPHTGTIASHLAAFHGAWGGVWGDELRHILLVDAIRPTGEADAIYATGDYLQWGAEGSWRRSVANIDELNLKIKWPHATVTYLFDGPSRLIAQYVMADGHSTTGLLQRISSTALGSRHLLEDVVSAGERVFLPHSTRPILLEARLYRHHEMKRAPLAIMNHGSAMGRDVHAGRSEFAQARWLMSNGYHVLVPMRRGRGLSQGEYGEDNYGRDASGTIIDVSAGVNEAVEDLASAITFGLSLPFVEAGPVLLMGQSRGGFLAAVYAGRHPQAVSGVVNFVGGWRGGGASEA